MRALLAPALALASLLTGCFQGEQTVVVYPDGSGTFTLRIRLKKALVRWMEGVIAKTGGVAPDGTKMENPLDILGDPARLMQKSEGIVAWTCGPVADEGEWMAASATGYFEDVAKVRIYEIDGQNAEGGRPQLTFAGALLRTESGTSLMITTHLPSKIREIEAKRGGAADPEQNEAMAELMKPMMKDLQGAIRITAPGPIRDARGFSSVDGRTASFVFDGETLLNVAARPDSEVAQRFRKLAVEGTRVTWTDVSVPDAELKAFRAELERHRAKGLESKAGAAAANPGLPDVSTLSDDEVDRLFIQAQIRNARGLIKGNRKDQAREILEGVIKDYPQQKATLEARTLLGELSK